MGVSVKPRMTYRAPLAAPWIEREGRCMGKSWRATRSDAEEAP